LLDEAAVRAWFETPDPLAQFCASRALWGSMAQDARLQHVIEAALERVDAWLTSRGRQTH
jgi:D-arabinitol 4-dehydrogenase